MAKIVKLRGPIREFTEAVGAYSRGGGNSRIYGKLLSMLRYQSFVHLSRLVRVEWSDQKTR